MVLSGPSRMVL
uniref:Uncharacterized protein n=1 Tax=Arundo donax TaxID=35708 RepID=A0A0A9BDA1_ARUDO